MLLAKNKPEELKAMRMRLEIHCAVFIPTGARFQYYEDLFTIMKTEFMSQYKWVDCVQLKAFCLALRRNVWAWVADMQTGENGNDEPVYRIFRPGNMPDAAPFCFSYPGASVETTIHLFYHKLGDKIVGIKVSEDNAKCAGKNASI